MAEQEATFHSDEIHLAETTRIRVKLFYEGLFPMLTRIRVNEAGFTVIIIATRKRVKITARESLWNIQKFM